MSIQRILHRFDIFSDISYWDIVELENIFLFYTFFQYLFFHSFVLTFQDKISLPSIALVIWNLKVNCAKAARSLMIIILKVIWEYSREQLNCKLKGNNIEPVLWVRNGEMRASQSRFYDILHRVNKTVIMTINVYESRAVI